MANEIYPTLVIGLGGTGCQMAESVYRRAVGLGLEDSGQIAVLGFDTDVHDIRRRVSKLGQGTIVQISTADRVLDILRRYPDAERTWFHRREELSQDILSMSLDEGAGQMRPMTRLAITDALHRGRVVQDVRQKLQRLSETSNRPGYQWRGAVHCYVLGSLAGATGCGSFLQIALIARQVAKDNGVQKISIRGLFLLPDVFIKSVGLTRDQEINVLVNGGAALRELNAFMQITNGHLPKNGVEFEYMPGRDLQPGGNPYDTVTFIDYEAVEGQTLGPNIEYYRDLAERIAFLQLFSPIGQEFSQRQVNSVQQRLAAASVGTTNCYSAVGLFVIRYPREAIVEYLTLRYALELLEGDWLAIDRVYRAQMTQYEEVRRQGDVRARPPDMATTYINGVDQRAKDRLQPFADIRQGVYRESPDSTGTETVERTFETYVDAVERHAVDMFWDYSRPLRELRRTPALAGTRFDDRETLAETVRGLELGLDRYWAALNDAVISVPDELYEQTRAVAAAAGPDQWRAHHLQSYVMRPPRHLIEVRYFLYLVRREIVRRRDALTIESLRQSVMEDTLDPKAAVAPGRRAGRAAVPLAEAIAEEGGLTKAVARIGIGKDSFKNFVTRYVGYYNRQIENMINMTEQIVKKTFYDKVEREVDILLSLLELLFNDLEKLTETLEGRLSRDATAHDQDRGAARGLRFVYAGREAKERMWTSIASLLAASDSGRSGNDALLRALMEERDRRARPGARHGDSEFSIRGLFEEAVVDGVCRYTIETDHRAVFDLDVIDAIREEAAMNDQDWRRHATDLIVSTSRKAVPFVNLMRKDAGSRLVYWAVSSRSREAIGDDEFFSRLFRLENEERALVEPDFDNLELSCVNLQYDFTMQDLSKLQPEAAIVESFHDLQAGRYDKAYRDRVLELRSWSARNPGRVAPYLSPHVDVRWLLPGLLPEIFRDVTDKETESLYRGFAAALGMDYLRIEGARGGETIAFYDPTRIALGNNRVSVCSGRDWSRALEEFTRRMDLGLAAVQGFEEGLTALERDADVDFETSDLAGRLTRPQVLASLFLLARNQNDPSAMYRSTQAMRAYFSLMADMVSQLRSDLSSGDQADLFRAMADGALLRAEGEAREAGQAGRLAPNVLEQVATVARNLIAAQTTEDRWPVRSSATVAT